MKNGSIFRNLELIPPNHQHLPQDQIASTEDDAVRLVGSGVIYYELLKPDETVAHRYHQQLIKLHRALREKRPYRKRHDKLIFLHDNAPSHTSTMVQNYLETFNWEVLPYPVYSPDLAPSDYHLFSSMDHVLAERHFDSYEDVRKWLDEWFASKDEEFFWHDIHKFLERWEKCIVSESKYFE